jgi:hypothetical protein
MADPALIGAFPERLARRTSKRGAAVEPGVVERPPPHHQPRATPSEKVSY